MDYKPPQNFEEDNSSRDSEESMDDQSLGQNIQPVRTSSSNNSLSVHVASTSEVSFIYIFAILHFRSQ